MTSILIRRPLFGKCAGSLMGKVLEARVEINDVTSVNDGVTISDGKVMRKKT